MHPTNRFKNELTDRIWFLNLYNNNIFEKKIDISVVYREFQVHSINNIFFLLIIVNKQNSNAFFKISTLISNNSV